MAVAGYGDRLRKRPRSEVNEKRLNIKKVRKSNENNSETLVNADDEDANLIKPIKTASERQALRKSRSAETEDEKSVVLQRCAALAEALKTSKHVVVYTGAGISTAADIPDFRGTNGIWTKLNSGTKIELERSLTSAVPTLTHLILQALYFKGIVKHIVSQNCDGLHLRSGIPQNGLSEIHGNMFMEICSQCNLEVYRIFDVTENTSLHRHATVRTCEKCGENLKDTIVHFGEWSKLRWPHNWESAIENAEKADMILCLGSSLKVLRSYKRLWLMNRPKHKRPKLYIVNLQWTPKDSQATMKVHSRVDFVMQNVAELLNIKIPEYAPHLDPLYSLATPSEYDGEKLSVGEEMDNKLIESDVKNRLEENCSNLKSPKPGISNLKIEKNYQSLLNTKTTDIKPDLNNSLDISSTSGSEKSLLGNTCLNQGHHKVKIPAWFGQGARSKRYATCKRRKRRK